MCGIIGYIGSDRNTSQIIINGLKRLEYRGYDSVGYASLNKDNKLNVLKCKGKVKELDKKISELSLNHLAIGHTRWATHGTPSQINSHPHIDQDNKFAIVHNGIIENYLSLKEYLISKGISFKTDTDTEVLVQLIGYVYKQEKISFKEAVRLALMQVVGTYGILIICSDEPNTLIAAKNGSPLLLGVKDEDIFIASDASPLIEHTRNIIYLEDSEMAILKKDSYEVFSINKEVKIPKKVEEIQYSLEDIEKGHYDSFMLKEIFEQPHSIQESLRGRINYNESSIVLGGISEWLPRILSAKQIYITACGTSWHASLIGSYIFEELLNIPVKVEYASEFRYRKSAINSESVLFAVSQSGETADTLAAVKKAKESGALTVGIVNVVGSSIARETDCGVYIHAGPEIGVASTKAFTSQVTILNLIAMYLYQTLYKKKDDIIKIIDDFKKLPGIIDSILKNELVIKNIAMKYVDVNNFLYLGRGYQFPVALEGALKLKEISYIHAEGYPAAEMKHGPIALIDNQMPVVFVVTHKAYDKIMSNIEEVKARGGKIIIVTSVQNNDIDKLTDDIIHIPDIHHCLSPITSTIPLQLLAYHIAVMKNFDVDQPRNLAKSVTVE